MDLRALLEKFDQFAGEKVGQKSGDQVRGTEKAKPAAKIPGTPYSEHPFKGRLVGGGAEQQEESILKDLSKGSTPKSKEQELAEEFQAFLEAEFKDTVAKRPGRKSDRPRRGHQPIPRYKTIKADESAMSEKDIELQDYRTMSHKEFQTAYKMTKTEWINKNKALIIQNPSIKKALGLEEGAEQDPVVAKVVKQMRPGLGLVGLDMANEAFLYYAYELGKNRARTDWEIYYPAIRKAYMMDKSKQAKELDEASDRERAEHRKKALAAWKEDHFGSSEGFEEYYGNDLDYQDLAQKRWDDDTQDIYEGWESGPEEYKEPYDDADDAYDRQRQEKIDTEAEKEWAKLPKVSTYKLLGRGPNMEPNYEFDGKEYDTLEAAIEARKQLMADPKTPHPEHIGIQTLTRVVDKEQTDETVEGGGHIKDYNDYIKKLDTIHAALQSAKEKDNWPWWKQRLFDLNRMAKAQGFPVKESRGHKIIATKLKDIERSKKFASGELKIPTPQERQAQLKKLETEPKQVKEYGAANPPQKTSPTQAQQVAANLNIQKTALNQLKQINPEIDPAKAAAAMTKDTATMSPQEKDELAQVAKTVSPALGTSAFGSIKTAIQKSQVK